MERSWWVAHEIVVAGGAGNRGNGRGRQRVGINIILGWMDTCSGYEADRAYREAVAWGEVNRDDRVVSPSSS